MTNKVVFEAPEFDIKVTQSGGRLKLFTVKYGKQEQAGLDYSRAAREFGLCMFHALACNGLLDNNGK